MKFSFYLISSAADQQLVLNLISVFGVVIISRYMPNTLPLIGRFLNICQLGDI